jgi:hypothetical protein
MDEPPLARVDRDVRDALAVRSEEQQIAGFQHPERDRLRRRKLLSCRARYRDAHLVIDEPHQSAAIEAGQVSAAPHVRSTQQGDRADGDLVAHRRCRRGRRRDDDGLRLRRSIRFDGAALPQHRHSGARQTQPCGPTNHVEHQRQDAARSS